MMDCTRLEDWEEVRSSPVEDVTVEDWEAALDIVVQRPHSVDKRLAGQVEVSTWRGVLDLERLRSPEVWEALSRRLKKNSSINTYSRCGVAKTDIADGDLVENDATKNAFEEESEVVEENILKQVLATGAEEEGEGEGKRL